MMIRNLGLALLMVAITSTVGLAQQPNPTYKFSGYPDNYAGYGLGGGIYGVSGGFGNYGLPGKANGYKDYSLPGYGAAAAVDSYFGYPVKTGAEKTKQPVPARITQPATSKTAPKSKATAGAKASDARRRGKS